MHLYVPSWCIAVQEIEGNTMFWTNIAPSKVAGDGVFRLKYQAAKGIYVSVMFR